MATALDDPPPSAWVSRFLPGVPDSGRVLDVACGSGRHLRLALAAGHPVTGIDRTLERVADLAGGTDVELLEADLEAAPAGASGWPLRDRTFAGVVVTNYLWRPILPDIVEAVARDGLLIYETFGVGHERFGRPRNPEHLLRAGELLDAVRPALTVVAYEHGRVGGGEHGRDRIVQRIAACGPEHPWSRTGFSR